MLKLIMVGMAWAFAAVGVAHADIPPPKGYVEQCTVAKQTQPGSECVSCDAWHGEMDKCDKLVGTQGYRRVCKTSGASVWGEVWCRAKGSKAAEPAKNPTDPTTAPTTPNPVMDPTTAPPAPTEPTPATTPASSADAGTTEAPAPKTADVPAKKKSNCAGGEAEAALGLIAALGVIALRKARHTRATSTEVR